MHDKLKSICEMKETLIRWTEMEMNKGVEHVNGKELGEIIDMIKDLFEAEEKCIKACYYEAKLEEMGREQRDEEETYSHRMGYRSSGRGSANQYGRSGYRPVVDAYYHDNVRMGFPMKKYYDDGDENRREMDRRYGKSYGDYQMAKRHYTSTKSMEDKEKMDQHAREHLMNSMESIREMYMSSDPELRSKIKTDLNKLINDMPG